MMKYNAKQKIGILGGGQLGRMLIQAAISYDVNFYVLDNDEHCPCRDLCHYFEKGSLMDYETVYQFGKKADILSIEIEHVNADALAALEAEGKCVIPSAHAIKTIQDKGLQKMFYQHHQIPSSDFVLIDSVDELKTHISFLPAFQKLRTLGYDGKGVQDLSETTIERAFHAPSLLEKKVAIVKEISVIVVKNKNGEIAEFPVVECIYNEQYNLVDYLISPADIHPEQEKKAKEIALRVVESLASAGIFAVELFLTTDGDILVNETAPRTHNSGHQSIEGNLNSQFDLQIKALLNLPFGSTAITSPSLMLNIIGAEGFSGKVVYKNLTEIMQMENTYLHLYGKKDTKPGRKMGHITLLGKDRQELISKAEKIKSILSVESE